MLNLKLMDDFKFITKMEIGNSLMQDFNFLLNTYNIFDEVKNKKLLNYKF